MHSEKIVSKKRGTNMVDADSITTILHPQFVEHQDKEIFGEGLNASPGAAFGEIVFDADVPKKRPTKEEM